MYVCVHILAIHSLATPYLYMYIVTMYVCVASIICHVSSLSPSLPPPLSLRPSLSLSLPPPPPLSLSLPLSLPPSSLSHSLPTELQWMSWSPFKLGLLLISAMQHSPSPAASFTQALTYFDLHNPLLSFLR